MQVKKLTLHFAARTRLKVNFNKYALVPINFLKDRMSRLISASKDPLDLPTLVFPWV